MKLFQESISDIILFLFHKMNCLLSSLYPLTHLIFLIFIGLRKSKVNTQAGRTRVIHPSYEKRGILKRVEGDSKEKRILTEGGKGIRQTGS